MPKILDPSVLELQLLQVIGPLGFKLTHTGCPARTFSPETVYVLTEPIELDVPVTAISGVLGQGPLGCIEFKSEKSVLSPFGPVFPVEPFGPGTSESSPCGPLGPSSP